MIASERLSNKTSSRTSFTDGPEKQNASILQSQKDVFVAWTVHLNILTPCLVLFSFSWPLCANYAPRSQAASLSSTAL